MCGATRQTLAGRSPTSAKLKELHADHKGSGTRKADLAIMAANRRTALISRVTGISREGRAERIEACERELSVACEVERCPVSG